MKKTPGLKKTSGRLLPLFKTTADEIEPNAVGIKTFATRSEYPNNLGKEVQHLTEFHFVSPDLAFRQLYRGDVCHSVNAVAVYSA